jgi:hypothetical protein
VERGYEFGRRNSSVKKLKDMFAIKIGLKVGITRELKNNTLKRAKSSLSLQSRKSIIVKEIPFYEPVKLDGHQ